MNNNFEISLDRPDDWHSHLREKDVLCAVAKYSSRVFGRCVAMPNLDQPVVNCKKALQYKKNINLYTHPDKLEVLIPCYLTDNIDKKDFLKGVQNNYFFGAKLYPLNVTTNSNNGVSNLDKIFPALEILEQYDAPLLIHAEKIGAKINIFEREKYFIDDEMHRITSRFPKLKIVLEHISSAYGANFVAQCPDNVASTITLHHLMLTKRDVFNDRTNPHNYCMPVVKNENDLICLRKFACSGNKKFFLGTDSAPHDIKYKQNTDNIKPGIFTTPIAIEMYTSIFEEEGSLDNLEKFASHNGANFYNFPYNKDKITLIKQEWDNPEFTTYNNIKIKNFMGGQKIKWKVVDNKL